MNVYYFEIKKRRGKSEIAKCKVDKEYKAREEATKLLKANRNIKEIKISGVVTHQYSSVITR